MSDERKVEMLDFLRVVVHSLRRQEEADMPDIEHKAPVGKFIVGEAIFSEDEWNQVGLLFDTVEAAQSFRDDLARCHAPDLGYYVYDENGLVKVEAVC
ncbi:MAG: hypothetical protein JWL88_222 [Parcubacteria group bacterium]|nr:hypothetical protein [Parcubacteria group bacterium]